MKILGGSAVYEKSHNCRERTITFGKNNNKVSKLLKPLLRRILRLTEILEFLSKTIFYHLSNLSLT